MSETIIKVEDIGKLYKLGEIGTGTISHDLNRWWARMRGKEDPYAVVGSLNDRTAKGGNDWVWALQHIDFEVKKGEVLGVIGRNGAGKSTLLKILSKVTSPTTGCIKVKGRIASLLEVGTGFHQELTGRENIFLNGAILGMNKAEIRSKLDEIIAFAGVERYIDTPVKRYSSGMYVRLAFSVAAFLEPEILIVDEVLAVGDAEFQKKCLGRMKDVSSNDGRTVLFVSHNMGAVNQLCNRAILLQNGRLVKEGETSEVVSTYVKSGADQNSVYRGPGTSSKRIWFKFIGTQDADGNLKSEFFHDEEIYFQFEVGYNVEPNAHDYSIFFMILSEDKTRLTSSYSPVITRGKLLFKMNADFFVRGHYSVLAKINTAQTEDLDVVEDVCSFEIIDNGSEYNIHGSYDYGRVFPKGNWLGF
jgi:lipopolysaccharide transport system ATP-binding protein